MSKINKILGLLVLFAAVLTALNYDLFNKYSILTAKYQLSNGETIYPQCEYSGPDLQRANEVSKEFGFIVVQVDCELFYSQGMENYYALMTNEIEKKNGTDWLSDFSRKMKKSSNWIG